MRAICDPISNELEQEELEANFSDRLMKCMERLERNPFDESAVAELERLESVMPDTAAPVSANPAQEVASMSDAQLIAFGRQHLGVELRAEDLPILRSNFSTKQMEKQTA